MYIIQYFRRDAISRNRQSHVNPCNHVPVLVCITYSCTLHSPPLFEAVLRQNFRAVTTAGFRYMEFLDLRNSSEHQRVLSIFSNYGVIPYNLARSAGEAIDVVLVRAKHDL